MILRLTAVCLLLGMTLTAQQPQVPTVDLTVEVIGLKVSEFSGKMDEYAALRRALQEGLPVLAVTDNPTEIQRAERLLAARIRKARSGARRHDIFTEDSRRAFRQLLRPLATPENCAFIADDNPGEWDWSVNSEYPKQNPVSSVPPSILAALPRLPDDVFYRFLDTDLVLHDTRANIMLDRIDNAIRCRP
ncbi:MAG TPA: hypothetical protein VF239_13260 [Vicinamibacterales bacterium]